MKVLSLLTRERTMGGRRAPSALDWLVALVILVIALAEVVAGVFPGPVGIAVAVQVAVVVPVAFRRVAPLRAITLSAAVLLVYVSRFGIGSSAADPAALLLLTYSLGRHARGPSLLAGFLIALLLITEQLVGAGLLFSVSDWAYLLILFGGTLGLGVALRVQTERSIALAVAADRAPRTQAATAQAAVRQERARIARELHDVVAHNVGLIVLQAGGARSVLDTDPGRARAALRQVEETGRQTLAEVRHLVGILREDEDEDEALPASLVHEAQAGRRPVRGRRRPSTLDWLVALALMAVALGEVATGMFAGPAAVAAAVQVAAILPVAFRCVAPLRAIAISTAISMTYLLLIGVVPGVGGSVAAAGTQLLLVYSVGRHARGRGLLAGAVIALFVAVEPGIGRQARMTVDDVLITLILVGGTLGLGMALRVQVERSIALAVAADRAESEQAATALAAVREERARIARELHDVVADKVGLIVLQAGGARTVLAADPERARAALLQVEETGRQTLAEMRLLVGLLREDADEDAERQPLPCLDRLPALLEETRAGGLTVDLEVEGSPVELPAGLELAAYRLVQEALTNVRKHAAGARAKVRIVHEPHRLSIAVSDDGGPPRAGRTNVHASADRGHGLIGMRERVQLYDGRMDAGPLPGGGFRVEAVLPIPERNGMTSGEAA